MKLERLVAMVYKLYNHEMLTAAALAEEYGVSQRTIYRDIDVLCAAGFPVVSHQGQNGGYGMMDGYKLDKSLLGSYDVEALITVLGSLSSVFEDGKARDTIERLRTIGPQHRDSALDINLETKRTVPQALPQLRSAILHRQTLEFDYVNAENKRTTRELEPLRLHFKYGSWYVYGFCRMRLEYREFRLSRMLDIRTTELTFAPHDHRPAEEPIEDPSFSAEAEEVIFRILPETLAIAMDQFPRAHRQFHPDGSLTMTLHIHRPLEARWLWTILMGFGSGAEVLKPIELRGILRTQFRQALHLYEED